MTRLLDAETLEAANAKNRAAWRLKAKVDIRVAKKTAQTRGGTLKRVLTPFEGGDANENVGLTVRSQQPDVVKGAAHPKKRGITPSEHDSQVAVIKWWSIARHRWKLPEFALYAVPNGGARTKSQGGKLKAEGVRAGIPDLSLDVPVGAIHGLKIEMKRWPNKPSPEQHVVMDYLRGAGYQVVTSWSADIAILHITAYLDAARPPQA